MRPYTITPEMHDELMQKFSQYIKSLTLADGNFSFSHVIASKEAQEKVLIVFEMKAYIKMRDLVDRFSSEVGWFGFVNKVDDFEYRITDICVYPQLVTGVTVKETNDVWDADMPIEQIKRRRFHGHSHVNMGVSPSSTDLKHRKDLISMIRKDGYYIFLITNKRCEYTAAVFDLANNAIYSTDEIEIDVDLGNGEMLSDFVEDAAKLVRPSTQSNLRAAVERRLAPASSTAPEIMTTTNVYTNGQSAWLPESAKKQEEGKKKKRKIKKAKETPEALFSAQTAMFDDDLESIEDYLAGCPDYYDSILGRVSDDPMFCSKAILAEMR